MPKNFQRIWLFFFACVAAAAFWMTTGAGLTRRLLYGVPTAPPAERTETRFLAVAFPRLTEKEEPFSVTGRRFFETMQGLRERGYTTIGLKEIEALYRRGERLPQKSILVALDRDNPESVRLADDVLKRLRMRALVFINTNAQNDTRVHRYTLSKHALGQLQKSGAWDFGYFAETPPERPPNGAVYDGDGERAWTRDPKRYPVRFVGSRAGYNDMRARLHSLRIMKLNPRLTSEELVYSIEAAWPRQRPFSDRFEAPKLSLDWVPEFGVIAGSGGRMALLPTPKQTGATVFLSGTEDWRDLQLEFELRKYQRAFWAYARENPDGGYVRVGLRGGYWYVQQKTGSKSLPRTLGREPVTGFPARVRLVLKDRSAVVDLGGRLAFSRAVEVSTHVEHGRISFSVYDPSPRSAMGIVTYVSAAPLPRRWLALNVDGTLGDFDPQAAQRLRDQSVLALALSPRWLSIGADGAISVVGKDPDFVRQLAGFNRCLLVPMAFLSSSRLALTADPAIAARLVDDLEDKAQELDAAGLNLRLPASLMRRREARELISELRKRLHGQGRRLWITLDGPIGEAGDWLSSVDGVLRPSGRPMTGVERLEVF
jgi:hypothetical protein